MSSVYLDSSKRSVKQTKVSRSSSSTEAKYRAVAAAQAKIMSIQKLVRELKIPQPVAPTIYCNNQASWTPILSIKLLPTIMNLMRKLAKEGFLKLTILGHIYQQVIKLLVALCHLLLHRR
ncbi:uncharacterized protein LOC110271286 isoform X6 [Arachis ipaensis]|uniref:uncharacterized protein LOC110271286 isoform X6 n=1 Tax=Arachis ipaensis TaxID=130454 RepID=UPI000A2B4C3C|nr:uncharacterized protein LOC110271286 isoform X6 [Arachis ipaensis]